MRKALLSILLILSLILVFLFIKNGLSIGSFHVYGFEDIKAKNDELTTSINSANTESQNYTSALSKLEQDVQTLTKDKKTYLDLIAQSTESEIRQATQTKTYTIEYLWSQIGNHATAQGVTLKMQLANSTLSDQEYRNLNFTADGPYLAITQFIYDLENDSNLDFTIDNFEMTASHATFTVKDVKIIRENTTQGNTNVDNSSNTNNPPTEGTVNTNQESTDNESADNANEVTDTSTDVVENSLNE